MDSEHALAAVIALALTALIGMVIVVAGRDSWHNDELKHKGYVMCIQAGNKPAECKGAMP